MTSRDKIRPASMAGFFYPADKFVLERDLSLLLENSPIVDVPKPIRGIIVPHAGYLYSGGVAARAYRQIMEPKYDFAVIIAPSHEETFDFISIYPGRGLRTPIGDLSIEMSVVDRLTFAHPDIRLSEKGYSSGEYSLEAQLPFLKWVQDSIQVVPIMMGNQNEAFIQLLTHVLTDLLKGENCLLIASTDLSHNHSDQDARMLDQVVMGHINAFDPDQLLADVYEKRCEMCGYGPTAVVMRVARAMGARQARVLLYRNTGDITGEKSNVVGYLSAIIY